MHSWRSRLALLIGAACLLAAYAPPATAHMAVSKYHPSANARTFHGGPGGWQGSHDYGGLCIPGLNCPQVTNSWQSGGFLRTKLSSLLGVAAESRGIWESPAFRYRGAAGKWPGSLRFKLKQRSRIGALLSVVGNSANYSAEIVDQRGGKAVAATPIDHGKLRQRPGWTSINIPVRPGLLVIGHRYTIRITTEFITGVEVFPGASVGYDDVLLRAARKTPRGGGGGHAGGGPPGRIAILHGNGLSIRVGCPRKYRRCRIVAVGLARRSGPRVTRSARTTLRGGHHKRLTLRVRPLYRHWVETHDRMVIRQKRTAHHHTHVRYRRVRIIHG
jgi:hypothetical protein